MALHGSGLRIGVHIHVENVEILLKAEHLSLHIYGHVNNFPEHQELHLSSQQRADHHLVQELHLWNTTKSVAQQECSPLRG